MNLHGDILTLKLKIPPPIYMLLTALCMKLLDKYTPLYSWDVSVWRNMGVMFIVLALFLDIYSLLQFLRGSTTINPLHPEKTEKLITTGMYRYSRNPMYVGLLYLLMGWSLILGSLSPIFMLPVFILLITKQQILPEEKVLEEIFGQQYRDYKQTVRRWL